MKKIRQSYNVWVPTNKANQDLLDIWRDYNVYIGIERIWQRINSKYFNNYHDPKNTRIFYSRQGNNAAAWRRNKFACTEWYSQSKYKEI